MTYDPDNDPRPPHGSIEEARWQLRETLAEASADNCALVGRIVRSGNAFRNPAALRAEVDLQDAIDKYLEVTKDG